MKLAPASRPAEARIPGVAPGLPRALWGRSRGVLLPLLGFSILIVFWAVAVEAWRIPAYQVPKPGAVLQAILREWPTLMSHAEFTGTGVLLGFFLSVIVAIPLAIVIAFSNTLSGIIYPLLVSTHSIPKVALAPLMLIWLGFGLTTSVVVAFLIAFFPIVISTVLGLKSMPLELKYLALSMGAGRVRTFLKIRLPYALPYIFSGLKVAITLAVVGAIVGEFVGANRGLGYYMLVASANVRTDIIFADIVVLSVLAMVLFYAVQLVEMLVLPWRQRRQEL